MKVSRAMIELSDLRERLWRRLQRLVRRFYRWHWRDAHQCFHLRLLWLGRTRASVYPNGVWWTWDEDGVGGENSSEPEIWKAKLAAFQALQRQEWI